MKEREADSKSRARGDGSGAAVAGHVADDERDGDGRHRLEAEDRGAFGPREGRGVQRDVEEVAQGGTATG